MSEEIKAEIENTIREDLSKSDKLQYTKQLNKLIDEMMKITNLLMNEDNTFMQDNYLQDEYVDTSKSIINIIERLTGKEYNGYYLRSLFKYSVKYEKYDLIQKAFNECFDEVEHKIPEKQYIGEYVYVDNGLSYDPFMQAVVSIYEPEDIIKWNKYKVY